MAGSISVTTREVSSNIVRYSVAWTSDASGNVSDNLFDMAVGTILQVEFVPGAGGVAPTILYDVDMLDDLNITLFDDGSGTSIGSNLSSTEASQKAPLGGLIAVTVYRRWHHGGPVQLRVSNAGNAKQGTVHVYVSFGIL